MEIVDSKAGDILVLAFKGRLDPHTSPAAHQRLFRWIDAGEQRLVADLSALDYISSAGLCLFLLAARRLKAAGGKLVFCSLSEPVREIFDIAGFGDLFLIYPGRAEALASFAQQAS